MMMLIKYVHILDKKYETTLSIANFEKFPLVAHYGTYILGMHSFSRQHIVRI